MKINIGEYDIPLAVEFLLYLGINILRDGRFKIDNGSLLAQARKAFHSETNLLVSTIDIEIWKVFLKIFVYKEYLFTEVNRDNRKAINAKNTSFEVYNRMFWGKREAYNSVLSEESGWLDFLLGHLRTENLEFVGRLDGNNCGG